MNNYKIESLSINPKLLAENGYKKYSDNMKDKNSYLGSWQKVVYNDYGKAYFINFNFFDNSYYFGLMNPPPDVSPFSWDADLQFEDLEEEMTVNVKIFSSKKDLESIEKFCDKMFKKMQFANYNYYSSLDCDAHIKEIKQAEIAENAFLLNKELPSQDTSEIKNKSKKKSKL